MKTNLLQRYETAIRTNPEIASFKSGLNMHKGSSIKKMESLGLSKKDLIRLSRLGLALKAYTRNFFDPPKENEDAWHSVPITYKDAYTDSRGYTRYEKRVDAEIKPKYHSVGKGMEVRWILIVPDFGGNNEAM